MICIRYFLGVKINMTKKYFVYSDISFDPMKGHLFVDGINMPISCFVSPPLNILVISIQCFFLTPNSRSYY